jgi:hypothetical protein
MAKKASAPMRVAPSKLTALLRCRMICAADKSRSGWPGGSCIAVKALAGSESSSGFTVSPCTFPMSAHSR